MYFDNKPLVSIIIPVYNGANYMNEAIDSALAQTYENVEIIIVNDGSTDNTEEIALSYNDKVRYFQKSQGGVASTLNVGISKMKGEYFSWLSHDDIYYPDKVKDEMLVLMKNDSKIAFCGWDVIDCNGEKINEILPGEKYPIEDLQKPLFALLHGMIGGCGLLIHRSTFCQFGLFREDLLTTQDFDLWFRMMRSSRISCSNKILYATRVHSEQGSYKYKNEHRNESESLWIEIMKTLTDEEKNNICGTKKKFYIDVYTLLVSYTSNKKAISYAKKNLSFIDLISVYSLLAIELFDVIRKHKVKSLYVRLKTVLKRMRDRISE
jgi:glycosyltransferase involved in cell wall biosynthesis